MTGANLPRTFVDVPRSFPHCSTMAAPTFCGATCGNCSPVYGLRRPLRRWWQKPPLILLVLKLPLMRQQLVVLRSRSKQQTQEGQTRRPSRRTRTTTLSHQSPSPPARTRTKKEEAENQNPWCRGWKGTTPTPWSAAIGRSSNR